MASRIGTAPFSPDHITNSRSPQRSRTGNRSSPTTTGRTTNVSTSAITIPSRQACTSSRETSWIVSPSATKTVISARLDRPDRKLSISPFRGSASSPSRMPATKTAMKPEPCREDRAVDHPRGGEDSQRVQRRLGERHPPDQRQQEAPAGHADRDADGHLDRELLQNAPERPLVARGELDHPDHERDADGIVRAGLALEHRAAAAADLAVAEDTEDDGRVRRSDGGAEQAGGRPREIQEDVAGEGHEPGCRERAEHAERQDRDGCCPEAAPADVQPAVEQDHDQRDDRDPLDLHEGERLAEGREQIRGDGRGDEEEGGRGHGDPLGDRPQEDRCEQPGGHDQDDLAEAHDLVHGANLRGDALRRRARLEALGPDERPARPERPSRPDS